MQIILDTYGLSLSVRNKCFLITKGEEKRMIHPSKVSSFLITMPCRISSIAIVLAVTNNIALTICSNDGKPEAKLWSARFSNTPALRRLQYKFPLTQAACNWSCRMIKLKLENQLNNLNFIGNRKPSNKNTLSKAIGLIKQQIKKTDSIPKNVLWVKKLRYLEASSANQYWQHIGENLPIPFYFEHRVKRNPTDAYNTGINYLYGMLRNNVETAILSLGLDPALGLMHVDDYNRPSLVFDIMEPFRPVVDRMLLEQILMGRKINLATLNDEGTYWLTRTGRKRLIELFNNKLHKSMLLNRRKTSMQNHILSEVQYLIQKLKENED